MSLHEVHVLIADAAAPVQRARSVHALYQDVSLQNSTGLLTAFVSIHPPETISASRPTPGAVSSLYLGFRVGFGRVEGFSRDRLVLFPGQVIGGIFCRPLHTRQASDCTQE